MVSAAGFSLWKRTNRAMMHQSYRLVHFGASLRDSSLCKKNSPQKAAYEPLPAGI
jgi:hypothetical protein